MVKRTASESCTPKVFVRSTKAGNAIKVFREEYLRDDIPCGSQRCSKCASLAVPDARGNLLAPPLAAEPHGTLKRGPHYVVVDTNICLKAIDILENPKCFYDVIVPQIVLEEVKNRSMPIYTRLRALVSGDQKRFYVFHNSFHRETHLERKRGESSNDFNDRAIRRVSEWYTSHLNGFPCILVSNDRAMVKIAEESGIITLSLDAYVSEYGDTTLMDLVASTNEVSRDRGNEREKNYPTYWSRSHVLGGLKSELLIQGKLAVSRYNSQEATVQGPKGPLLIIGREHMNRAFDGDTVAVELLPESEWSRLLTDVNDDDQDEVMHKGITKQPQARVVSVIKRNWRFYVGHIASDSVDPKLIDVGSLRSVLFRPMDRRVPRIRFRTRQPNALAGQRIVVAVDDWPAYAHHPEGHFVRALGDIESHGAETEAILLEYDIEYRPFPKAAIDCLPTLPWTPEPDEKRRDLRNLDICSIDPPRCQDIDDALHARQLPNGNIEVGVHIADVTHFVRASTAIDDEGAIRGTSTYLVDRRIDMLPSLLGTDLCSLRPNVERYAFSVIWEVTPDIEVVSTDFTKSLIRSRHAYEYEEAQAVIDDPAQTHSLAVSMRILLDLSRKLRQRRMDAGALNLASPEVKVHLESETADPAGVEVKKGVATNSLVEEFMLFANIAVARKIHEAYPQSAMLRRHAAPPASNFDQLNDELKVRGLPQLRVSSSKALAESLDAISGEDPFINTLVRIMATRCMMAAEYFAAGSYSYPEFRHYGLATDIYTHFTSPIRRYADVIVHRQLAAAIGYEKLHPSLHSKPKLDAICDNINLRHRNAQLAGRASIEYYVGQMLKSQPEVAYEGYVVRVFSNGIGVLVPRYGLESVVKCEGELDEDNYILATGGRKIQIFDKISVVIRSVKNEATGKRSVEMVLA